MDLAEFCDQLTSNFPDSEPFGLISQIRRCGVSIPANIAEGHGRKSTGAFLNHLSIANGSMMELETHILLGQRLSLVDESKTADLLERSAEAGRMLNGLIRSLRDNHPRTTDS